MTDEELDEAAQITPADIRRIVREWGKGVSRNFRNALAAEEVQDIE